MHCGPDLWHGIGPLHTACIANVAPIVRLLLDAGAVVDERAAAGEVLVLVLVLALGGPATARLTQPRHRRGSARTQTPLLLACYSGALETARLLLQAGASVDAVDAEGRGIAHHAAMANQVALLHFLRTYVALGGRPSALCAQPPSPPAWWTATVVDRRGRTPLHLAAQSDKLFMVRYLLRSDAPTGAYCEPRCDPAAVDTAGSTALHYAAAAGSWDCCWWLATTVPRLQEVRDADGRRPIDVASTSTSAFGAMAHRTLQIAMCRTHRSVWRVRLDMVRALCVPSVAAGVALLAILLLRPVWAVLAVLVVGYMYQAYPQLFCGDVPLEPGHFGRVRRRQP